MLMKAPQTEAKSLNEYLTSEASIAEELLDASKYAEIPLRAHRNFGSAKLVRSGFRRSASNNIPSFSVMERHMAKEFVDSPAVTDVERRKFVDELSSIRVPYRDISAMVLSDSFEQGDTSNCRLDFIRKSAEEDVLPELNTASEILYEADEIEKPVEQERHSTYALREWLKTHKDLQAETAAILQEKKAPMNTMKRREIRLHKQFWNQLEKMGELKSVQDAKMTSIFTGASNLCQKTPDERALRNSSLSVTQIHLQKRAEERAKSVEYGKSRLSQEVYYEDLARERGKSVSSGRHVKMEGSVLRGWKGYSINELRCKHEEHRGQSLNEIGLGATVTEIASKASERGLAAITCPESITRNASTRSKSLNSRFGQQCSRQFKQCISGGEEDTIFEAFDTPSVLQEYKHELDVELEKAIRANSVDLRRWPETEQSPDRTVAEKSDKEENTNEEEENSLHNEDFEQSLREIQQEMLLPGTEPLPIAFNYFYQQFRPSLEEPILIEEEESPLSCDSRITTDIEKASLLAKAIAINSATTCEIQQLKTNEEEAAEEEAARIEYKPPVQLSKEERYIAEQRALLESAEFPVETFPQLAIFTKLSSLNVEVIKNELKSQIEELEHAEIRRENTEEDDLLANSQGNADSEPEFERNFLRELRSKQAEMWNEEYERINERSESREFRRKHVPPPAQCDIQEIELEISEKMKELQTPIPPMHDDRV